MPDADMVANLLSNGVYGGVLVWFMYYTVSVAQPKRDEHYTNAMRVIAADFTETIRQEREFRRLEMQELKQSQRCRYETSNDDK